MSASSTGKHSYHVGLAQSDTELKTAIRLFMEYARMLGIDLTFQDFQAEIATFPGKYSAPVGRILLAHNEEGRPLGCVALRALPQRGYCEMKRLYVLSQGRGLGVGRALVEAIIQEAERIGYSYMRLDTLPSMVEAQALYRKAGFADITAYYDTPLADTVFMELVLNPNKTEH